MTQQCFSLIRGRAMRVTKLDGCGVVVPGSQSSVVSKGFVSIGLTANTEEGEEIQVTNANGDICISDTPPPRLIDYGLEINLCGVEPLIFNLTTGQPLVKDPDTGTGLPPEYLGFRSNTKVDLSAQGFGLEVWSSVPSAACAAAGGVQQYGYFLLPFIQGGIIGDFTIENGAINFIISGARTKDGSGWGVGPYNVVPGVGQNAKQTVTITGTPTGGTIKLTFDGEQTGTIAYNATATVVQAALVALDNIGEDDVIVTGGPGPGTPWVIEFTGALAGAAQDLMTSQDSLTGGTDPESAVTSTQTGSSGGASPLEEPITEGDHLHVQLTNVAPPTAQCGAVPVGTEATGATEVEGAAATLTPPNSYAPWDLTDAQSGTFTASPGTAWDTGSYVLTESGQKIYWTSSAWAAGVAP